MDFSANTRIIDLTVGELVDIIRDSIPQPVVAPVEANRMYDYGIAGIARTFGCSQSTAKRIKASGKQVEPSSSMSKRHAQWLIEEYNTLHHIILINFYLYETSDFKIVDPLQFQG